MWLSRRRRRGGGIKREEIKREMSPDSRRDSLHTLTALFTSTQELRVTLPPPLLPPSLLPLLPPSTLSLKWGQCAGSEPESIAPCIRPGMCDTLLLFLPPPSSWHIPHLFPPFCSSLCTPYTTCPPSTFHARPCYYFGRKPSIFSLSAVGEQSLDTDLSMAVYLIKLICNDFVIDLLSHSSAKKMQNIFRFYLF